MNCMSRDPCYYLIPLDYHIIYGMRYFGGRIVKLFDYLFELFEAHRFPILAADHETQKHQELSTSSHFNQPLLYLQAQTIKRMQETLRPTDILFTNCVIYLRIKAFLPFPPGFSSR